MTTFEFYQRTREILDRSHDASVIEDIKALCVLDVNGPREMRREDWVYALQRIEKQLDWLRSIFYPASKPQIRYKQFVEQHIDTYAVA